MSDNPYAPPEAPKPEQAPAPASFRGAPYALLLFAFAVYCLAMERWVAVYGVKEAIDFGAIPPLPILCFLIGSGALMTGVGRHMYLPWLGRQAFWLASAVLAIGIVALDGSSPMGGAGRLLFGGGLAIGLFGAWVVNRACNILAALLAQDSEGRGGTENN